MCLCKVSISVRGKTAKLLISTWCLNTNVYQLGMADVVIYRS